MISIRTKVIAAASLMFLLVPSFVQAAESVIIPNGDFETMEYSTVLAKNQMTAWNMRTGAVSSSSTYALDFSKKTLGQASYKVGAITNIQLESLSFPVTSGAFFNEAIDFMPATGSTTAHFFRLYIYFFDAAGNDVTPVLSSRPPNDVADFESKFLNTTYYDGNVSNWRTASVWGTVPAGAVTAVMRFYTSFPTFNVDNARYSETVALAAAAALPSSVTSLDSVQYNKLDSSLVWIGSTLAALLGALVLIGFWIGWRSSK